MKKRFLSVLLVLCMVLTLMPMAALADFADTKDHWGKDSIDRWAGVGVLNGKGDDVFDPNGTMTRAEFAQMLCNMMGYTKKAENTYTDIEDGAWYADAMLKLIAAGVINGMGEGVAAPNAPITREQAAVMLCRAFSIKTTTTSMSFADAGDVAPWAQGAVATLASMGMIGGVGDNSVAPQMDINRASVAKLIDNMVAEYVTEDKTITGEVDGIVLVADGANVKFEDANVSAPIVVAPGAEGAKVDLSGTTEAGDVVVAAAKAEVKVEGKADAVEVTESAEGAKTTVGKDAEVKDITVAAPKAETEVAGKVESVAVAEAAEGAKTTVGKDAEVKDMSVAAPKAETSVSGKVENVAVEETATGATVTANAGAKIDSVTTAAEDVKVDGKGEVGTVTAEGGSVDVSTKGTEVANNGADKVTTDGGKGEVADGETATSTGTSSSGGSSGGSNTETTGDYKVSIPSSFVGGKVTADPKSATEAGATVTLTVTPDPQNGATMPYVLKSLTVTKPAAAPAAGDGEAVTQADAGETVDLTAAGKTGTATFTMDNPGTYTVAAEFEQPITKAVMYVADGTNKTAANMEADGYTPEGDVTDAQLATHPYFFIGMTKNADTEATYTLSDFAITANGSPVALPTGWGTPSTIFKFASAYVGNEKHADDPHDADKLGFTGSACTFVLTFKCGGADYELSCDYTKPGLEDATIYEVKFGTTTYKAVEGEKVKAPAVPENTSSTYYTGTWTSGETTLKANQEYTVAAPSSGTTITFTADSKTIGKATTIVRPNGVAGETANFEYDNTYKAAGITVTGGSGTAKIDVTQKTAIGFITNNENSAKKTAITQRSDSEAADCLFVGVAVAAPNNEVTKVIVDGDELDVPSVSETGTDVFKDANGNVYYISYYPAIKADGTALDAKTWNAEQLVWMKGDDVVKVETFTVTRNAATAATYTVTFDSDSGSAVNAQTVNYNDKATKPNEPTKANNYFDGWYLMEDNTMAESAYDFNTVVTKDITLKAKWVPDVAVTLSKGNEDAASKAGATVTIDGQAAKISVNRATLAKYSDLENSSLYHAGDPSRLYACIGFTVPTIADKTISKFDIVITGGNQTGDGYERTNIVLDTLSGSDMDKLDEGVIGDWFGFALVNGTDTKTVAERTDVKTPWTVTISWKDSEGNVIGISTFTVELEYTGETPTTPPTSGESTGD